MEHTCKMDVPWVDKYRPNKLNGIVHQTELLKTLKNILETGDMPHLLFYGPPGTGKTTTILALANELFGHAKFRERVLELNASDERGISTVRNDIIKFAKLAVDNTTPIFNETHRKIPPYKILILDEADAMTPDAQSALRKVMEETSNVTRFCIICNYIDRIIDPIISRCMQFRFLPINLDTMKTKLKSIAKVEHIELTDCVYDTIFNITHGDLRRGIMMLQNIKYMPRTDAIITPESVCELNGYAPPKIITEIINACNNSEYVKAICDAHDIYFRGYPISNMCEQLCVRIVDDNTMDDTQKSQILTEIPHIYSDLNKGSSEMIQFMKIVTLIWRTIHHCDDTYHEKK